MYRAPAAHPTALKRALGGLGYEFTPDAFFQVIGDHDPKAVGLFVPQPPTRRRRC